MQPKNAFLPGPAVRLPSRVGTLTLEALGQLQRLPCHNVTALTPVIGIRAQTEKRRVFIITASQPKHTLVLLIKEQIIMKVMIYPTDHRKSGRGLFLEVRDWCDRLSGAFAGQRWPRDRSAKAIIRTRSN